MIQLIIDIPDDHLSAFQEFLRGLPWAKVKQVTPSPAAEQPLTPEQQEWVNGLKHALHQVEQHQRGEIKLRSAWELLDEL